MNNICRGPLGDASYQISELYDIQFQRRRILMFSFLVPIFPIVTPRHHLKKPGRGLLGHYMPNIKALCLPVLVNKMLHTVWSGCGSKSVLIVVKIIYNQIME